MKEFAGGRRLPGDRHSTRSRRPPRRRPSSRKWSRRSWKARVMSETLNEPVGRDVNGHALLELQRISKFFGNIIALQNITTSVRAGEVTCVLGDNGAGKSTFIKILAGV